MIKQNSQKKFFWILLLLAFLLSAGQITASFASETDSDLIINEFVADNGSGLIDEDGDYSDWIEIYNRGDSTINLGGWSLTDDPNQPQKWAFPDMSLGSHQYLLVFASGKDRVVPGANLHTNFKLGRSGEFLALHNVLARKFMDTIAPQYPEQFRDVSYGRLEDGVTFGYLNNPTPGRPNDETFATTGLVEPVQFSVARGFYESPFSVALATDTPGAVIRYTTDGSEPSSNNGRLYTEPIPVEGTTLLRAVALKPGFLASPAATHTYIFTEDILRQFPTWDRALTDFQPAADTIQTGAEVAGLTNEGLARQEIRRGLTSIPSVSVVMDTQSLNFLLAHPDETGKDSERPVSFEMIYADGDESGAQVNAGLRAFGAGSGSKPSFRLSFRSEYGAAKFEYPLFPDSPTATFDTLILQAVGSPDGDPAAYLRNQWLRASQIAMSGLGSHGILANLYVNGRYVGLYNLIERPNADFMASYLGGEAEDWFVANQAGVLNDDLDYQNNKLGYLFTALALSTAVDSDLTSPEHLADTYAAAAAYLDPADLADYILLSWYADILGWSEQSWYAAIRHEDLPGRGKLLLGEPWETPAESGGQADFGQSAATPLRKNIHRLHLDTLMADPDFKVRFADRLYEHLSNNGLLADATAQARWQSLYATAEPAILTEIARWGSNAGAPADGVPAQMAGAAARLTDLAREAGYYPEFGPPRFSHRGGLVEAGFPLEMALPFEPCQDCRIYYTTDGSDPRLPITGDVIPIAFKYDGPVVLDHTTRLKARVWRDGEWSALHETTFNVVDQDNKLRITEIMYNPLGGDDYEFIELQNLGDVTIDLTGFALDEGVRFSFLPGTAVLSPGEFAVLASNPEAFLERYPGVALNGAYDGHLSNKGEKVILKDPEGQIFIEVEYNDSSGWPISADGRGDSLTLVDQDGVPGDPKNWRASTNLYGSPGAADPGN
jgi:hypothetical protein